MAQTFNPAAFESSAFEVTTNSTVSISLDSLLSFVGTPVVSAGATVISINDGLSVNIGTVVITADANTSVTCNGIAISVGSPTIELITEVTLIGVSASFNNGTAVVNAAANVVPSGVQLNIICNNAVTWGLLSTGVSETWLEKNAQGD